MTTLLDELARMGDPDTSQAAGRLDHSGLCARALESLVAGGAGTTDEVLARLAHPLPDRNVLARRITTLVKKGLAVDTRMRRLSPKGSPAAVWAATPEGRQWVRS